MITPIDTQVPQAPREAALPAVVRDAIEDYQRAASNEARGQALDSLAELAERFGSSVRAGLRYPFDPPGATLEDYRVELRRGMGERAADQLFADLSDLACAAHDGAKRKVVIISATFVSGGVAEMFRTQANILGALGITVEWHTAHAGDAAAYAEIGRKVYDALQGGRAALTEAEIALWKRENERLARILVGVPDDPDVAAVFVEDYHPIHLVSAFKERNKDLRVIWRAHNDHHGILAGAPAGTAVWQNVLKPELMNLGARDSALFQPGSAPTDAADLPCGVFIEPAGIDPLALKNTPLQADVAPLALEAIAPEIDPERPALVAGGRYVVWKGLLPLLRAWQRLADDHPEVDLVLFGAVGSGDARKIRYARQLEVEIAAMERARPEWRGRVHLLKLQGEDIRPFYALAAKHNLPFCQPSLREGYGLMADEAARQGAAPFTTLQGGLRRFEGPQEMYGFCVDTRYAMDNIPDAADMYVTTDEGNSPTGLAVSAFEAQLYTQLDALLVDRAISPEVFAQRYAAAADCAHGLALSACLVVMSRDYLSLCVASAEQVQSARANTRGELTANAARLAERVLDDLSN